MKIKKGVLNFKMVTVYLSVLVFLLTHFQYASAADIAEGDFAVLKISGKVLKAPSGKAKPSYSVTKGERVKVGKKKGKWAEIFKSSGQVGWVPLRSLKPAPVTEKKAPVSKAAPEKKEPETKPPPQEPEQKAEIPPPQKPAPVEENEEMSEDYETMTVSLNSFDLYSKPKESAPNVSDSEEDENKQEEIKVVANVKPGSKLKALGEKNDWIHLGLSSKKHGWVKKKKAELAVFELVDSDFEPITQKLDIYFTPADKALRKNILSKGTKVKVLALDDEWALLTTRDGVKGWASAKKLLDESDEENASESPESNAPLKVALFKFETVGVEDHIASIVYEAFMTEIQKLKNVSVIGKKEIAFMLDIEQQKQFLSCDEDSCMAEIAGALAVDVILPGTLAKMENTYSLTVKLIGMESMRVENQFTKNTKGSMEEAFIEQIGPAVEYLFPKRSLVSGMTRGVSSEVKDSFYRAPLKPYWFWTAAGLSMATGLSGGLMVLMANNKHTEFEENTDKSLTQYVDAADLTGPKSSGQTYQLVGSTLLITAGVSAITASILAIWTDWKGTKPTEEKNEDILDDPVFSKVIGIDHFAVYPVSPLRAGVGGGACLSVIKEF